MNQAFLVGNLTADPQHSVTPNGTSRCSFRIATERNYTNPQTGKRESDFHNIVTWRQLADNCARYLTKGRQVAVRGSIQYRSYQAKDGSTRYMTEILAEDVRFLGSGNRQQSDAPQEPTDPQTGYTAVETDELPF